jgi:hypothetical protein
VLRQSIGEPELRSSGKIIELGEFNDILNKDAITKHIGIGVSVKLKEYKNLSIPSNCSYSCDTYWGPVLDKINAKLEGKGKEYIEASWSRKDGNNIKPQTLKIGQFSIRDLGVNIQGNKTFDRPISTSGTSISGPYIAVEQVQELAKESTEEAKEIFETLPNALNNIYYVPAIRGVEKKVYVLGNSYVVDITTGSNTQLATTFAYASGQIKEMVEIWSEEITGSGIRINLIPDKKLLIESAEVGGIPVIVDGSGVNQLVQLLLMFGIVPSESTLGIEEPEIHLHPKAQRKLCSLLAKLIRDGWKRQLIITTHSESILYGFLNEVKEGNMDRDNLKIYYFEEKKNGPARVEIDEGGDTYDWGKNFFEYT